LPVENVLDCYRGMGELAHAHDMVIAGGDIVSSRELNISVTVLGETIGGRFLSRSGAQPGDVIAVSGTLGAAAAGLRLLQLPEDDPRRDAATAPLLVDALHRPTPRVALGQQLLKLGATSAMDLSDGLLGDLPKILHACALSAEIREADIPIAAAVHALFPDEWLGLGLRGGEDYELLFTAPTAAVEAIIEAAASLDQKVTPIGGIHARSDGEPPLVMVTSDGERRVVEPGAFDHFGVAP
jgi:thiamine-monophosphate kinase